MKKMAILIVIIGIPFVFLSQNKDLKYGIEFSGFIKNDFFYDTRQNVSIREGHFLVYPSPILLDSEGKDINATGNFNFLSIQTRLTGKITGPDAFGAKTSGVIEADFFGNENANFVDANGFRLRHAFTKLNWEKTELLFGQYWHPFFNPASFPGVISFNTGAPFQSFSRNPQIRLSYKINKFNITGVANSQRDFVSPGGSSGAIRNSGIPELSIQFGYSTKNDSAKTEFMAGAGGSYKTLRPRLSSSFGGNLYKVDETVESFAGFAFLKLKTRALTLKMQGVYGQNLFDLVMLGGYAVDTISDPITGLQNYLPYTTASVWFDGNTNGSTVQFGFFAGYTRNLGLSDELGYNDPANLLAGLKTNSRGFDIQSLMRFSPRIVFISGKLNFALECEYTSAAYATKTNNIYAVDNAGIVSDTENVANVRGLFSVIYTF